MDESDLKDRYQFQPPHVKLWRRRHQLRVPFEFARMVYWSCVKRSWFNTTDPLRFRVRACWGIVNGYADMRMKRYYTMDEVMEEFGDG